MQYYFGKDFTMYFTYDEEFKPLNNIPSISIFSENPTRAEAVAQAGTYKIGSSITAWADTTYRAKTKSFIVPAIPDEEPNDNKKDYTYYVAIKYKLQTDEDDIIQIIPFIISRYVGTLATPNVDPLHVKQIFPTIEKFIEDKHLEDFISIAFHEIERDLAKRNLKIKDVVNLDRLHYAIALKSIAMASHSEFKDETDQFYTRYKDYNKMYYKELDSIILYYDKNGDGLIDDTSSEKIYFKLNLN